MTSTNDPEKKESQPPRPESTATEGYEAAEQAPLTVIDVLHTLVNEYQARDDQNSRLQRQNFWLGIVTAVLLFAYTTVAALQWNETRRANGVAQTVLESTIKNVRLDQRAWVGVGAVFLPELPMVKKQLEFVISGSNTGKTPGLRVTYQTRWGYSGPGSLESFKSFTAAEGQPGSHVAPPGGIMYRIIISDPEKKPLTEEDVFQILRLQRPLYLYGIITYEDVFGKSHFPRFCSRYIYNEKRPTVSEWCKEKDYNYME